MIVPLMDAAKSLADARCVDARRKALQQAHMAPLVAFVHQLRASTPHAARVPDFDPFDGGVQAECLFLLEAPGGRAVGSCFVSRNNPDETAKNFFELNREAGLARERTVVWNVVPWYVGSGTRIRPVTPPDLAQPAPHLQRLLALLPRLRVVVLVGRKAQRARGRVEQWAQHCLILECPHPSPMCLNRVPTRRDEIRDVLESARSYLDHTAAHR